MAGKLRDAADDPKDISSTTESLRQSIHRWERGGTVSERYRYLYCRVFGRTEFELFGAGPPGIITRPSSQNFPFDARTSTRIVGATDDAAVASKDISGNCHVVLVLPSGTQRVVIDITSADASQPSGGSQPVRRLTLAGDARLRQQ